MKGLSILTALLFLTGSPMLASCEKSIVQSGEMEEVDMDVEGNGEVSLLYMGQASIRIVTETGHVIYIDPYAGNQYELAADLILVTHEHVDHNKVIPPNSLYGGTYRLPCQWRFQDQSSHQCAHWLHGQSIL